MRAARDFLTPDRAAALLQDLTAQRSGSYHLQNIARRYAIRRADLTDSDPQLAADLETLLHTLRVPIPTLDGHAT